MTWSVWPARDRPGVALCVALVVAALAWATATLATSALVAVAAAVALLLSLHRFFLPVRCTIGSKEAVVETLLFSRRLPIASVRRIAHDGTALLLSKRAAGARSALSRGLIMPLPRRHADRVVRAAGRKAGKSVAMEAP